VICANLRDLRAAIDAKTVNASFEMASPQTPEDFKMYLEGKAFKVK
jgi:hypothetical protein